MSHRGTRSGLLNTHYFNIDDIFSTQERVPCQLKVPLVGLGFLDPSSDSENVQPGVKLEIPYWLGYVLSRRHFVNIEIPKTYREAYREILSADASVVDLHQMGPYFYAFGINLLNFEHADFTSIAATLVQSFRQRFRKIMDCSQNSVNEDTSYLTAKLDEMERGLFQAGQISLKDIQGWESRENEKITTSVMVSHHRKRKRTVTE